MKKIFINKYSYYKPSAENLTESPKLEYVDSLFKRRLSQISKMTIEVVHNVMEENDTSKLVFTSFRGEIARQLKINKGLVEECDVMPASFSISVFNTPPAVATISLNLKSGYTAIYPSKNDFASGLISATSSLFCNKDEKIIFVYADELIPREYEDCAEYTNETPLAISCVFSTKKETESAKEVELNDLNNFNSPEEFLKFLIK